MPLPLRLAAVAVSFVGGALVGVLSVVVHSWVWGLALALAAVAATIAALPVGARPPFAVGWAAAVGLLALGRPEGDVLVAQDATGVVLVLAAPVVVAGGFAGLIARRAASPEPDAGRTPSDT